MNSTAISLGWDCGPAIQGVERGLRTIKEHGYQTCPFDLMITNYLGIIDCIDDDFKYFCDPEYLHIYTIENDCTYLAFKKGNRVIVNTKYNFIFNHESPGHGNLYIQENWENGIEHFVLNNFKEFIERYNRRIQNFRNYIHDPNTYIHFIISKIGASVYENSMVHANRGLEILLNEKYPNLKYDFVNIDETRYDIFNEGQELMLTTIPSFFLTIQKPLEDNYKVAFIIAHKYVKGYYTNIDYYVSNIQKYYKNSSIFIVDNQSSNLEDVQQKIQNNENVHFLINDSESRFELGAYQYGIKHILNNINKLNNFDYYVFTQDSYILKNKYDFNILKNNRIWACPIIEIDDNNVRNSFHNEFTMKILMDIKVSDILHKLTLCFANSFILHQSKLEEFQTITQDIIIKNKFHSQCSERFLAGILYKLNEERNFNIDGFKCYLGKETIDYNHWSVNEKYYQTNKYFIKKINNKTENVNPLYSD